MRYGLLSVLVVVLLCLSGCGYTMGTDSPSVLAPEEKGVVPTLKIRGIDNPTMFAWLPHILRTQLRDEIAARGLARWVDSGPADYEISVRVDKLTFRSWMSQTEYVTLLYSPSMTMSLTIYKGNTADVVWRSKNESYSQTYESINEQTAATVLARELIRRLTTGMRQAF